MLSLRIILAGVGFLSVFFMSPWVTVLCMVLLALRFPAWEVLVFGILIDFLWLPAGITLHSFPLFTIAALTLVWGLHPVRRQLLV